MITTVLCETQSFWFCYIPKKLGDGTCRTTETVHCRYIQIIFTKCISYTFMLILFCLNFVIKLVCLVL